MRTVAICIHQHMMDVEKLIGLIFGNRSLWDMKQNNYHNRDTSRQKWENIAREMESNVEAVKNKWRGLRDTFRKELNKLPKTRSGQEGGPVKESKWPYFKNMMFLKDQFIGRKLQSSILEPEIDTQSGNDSGNDGKESDDLPQDDFVVETNQNVAVDQDATRKSEMEKTGKTSQFHSPQTKRAKTLKSDAIQQLLTIEQEKLKEFKRKTEVHSQAKIQEDADYHFLMSLLPYLRKVPEERKMDVRIKLQQVFSDEEKLARQQCSSRNSSLTNPSRFNSRPSAELPQHSMENYGNPSEFMTFSRPSSRQSSEHHLENYGNSSEWTTLSRPGSVQSSEHHLENYGNSSELTTLSRPGSVQSSEHHLENYGNSSELTTLSRPGSVQSSEHHLGNYGNSSELTTLSRPCSGQSSQNRQCEDIASFFANTNPHE